MQRSIRYGETTIRFAIHFVPRPRRRVSIHVLPDSSVRVDAPEGTEPEDVVAAVGRRARWIWQQLEAQRERKHHLLPREYVSGESHYYLGRRHVLKVIEAPEKKPGVKLLRGQLLVTVRRREREAVRAALEAWYRQRAREVFARRIADHVERAGWLMVSPPFRLLDMRTQWGSCSPKGELILNPALVKAPRLCVDYVVAHELCHLREHNHGPEFYRLLAALMPDWETHKRELDGLAEGVLNR